MGVKGSAVVTGAAMGIGLAVAQRLAGDGYHVDCVDWNAEALDRALEHARRRGDRRPGRHRRLVDPRTRGRCRRGRGAVARVGQQRRHRLELPRARGRRRAHRPRPARAAERADVRHGDRRAPHARGRRRRDRQRRVDPGRGGLSRLLRLRRREGRRRADRAQRLHRLRPPRHPLQHRAARHRRDADDRLAAAGRPDARGGAAHRGRARADGPRRRAAPSWRRRSRSSSPTRPPTSTVSA